MASREMEKSVKEKEPKQPSASASAQEPSSAVSADIATSHSSGSQASSPQPHPYMWGVQHMMMLPYGTPPHPYVTMYPPGGMYAHPSMPPGSCPYTPYAMPSPNGVTEASVSSSHLSSNGTIGGIEGDSKRSDVKEKFRMRRLKRRLKMMRGKRPPVSQNVPIMPKTAAGVPGPPTNLNIGIGYWGAPTSAPIPGVFAHGGRSQPWLQDVTEPKRQRRRQSNRESARRSRLRKEAGFDELARYTEGLNAENASLRAEMNRLKSQREELTSENTSLKGLILSFPPLEGIKLEKDDQEPDTYQTGFTETKFVSYKDSTLESKTTNS